MKLTVLVDDNSGSNCKGEHGLSLFVEDDAKVLFDAGSSDLFLKNSRLLGLDIDNIDCVILSHGHWDHGNGLKFIKNKKLICHPDCFLKRYRRNDGLYVGLSLNLAEVKKNFDLILSRKPYNISKNIIFLGEIPRENNFEAQSVVYYQENEKNDFVPDDSALAIKSKKGLIVIAGCSHSGICNIVEYAKKISGVKKVFAVIGGFHLKALDETAVKTIEYFKKERIPNVYPLHCVDNKVVNELSKQFGSKRIACGDAIDI